MSATRAVHVAVAPENAGGEAGIEEALRTLAGISGDLLESYRALERRAERVEEELSHANAELEAKVAELDRVTRHLERILEALPVGVVVRGADGLVERANSAALRIFEREACELVGTPGRLEYATGAHGGDGRDGARELRRRDGARLVLATRRSTIDLPRDGREDGAAREDGEASLASVEILDDRTELAELSERLHALDKLAALGNMAGGIAHELRNPMNAIKGFAALLARGLEAGTREHRWAGLIVAGVSEADLVLTSMLALARPERLALERIDGAELLESALRCEQEGRAHPEQWTVASAARVPAFAGDKIQLRQALRNLIANAFDAQPRGGAVSLELSLEKGELVARVADAGPGILTALGERVLEPFFTTRAQGTGLGLALVSAIAQAHGGRVEVSARPSPLGGAEVALRIPFRAVP